MLVRKTSTDFSTVALCLYRQNISELFTVMGQNTQALSRSLRTLDSCAISCCYSEPHVRFIHVAVSHWGRSSATPQSIGLQSFRLWPAESFIHGDSVELVRAFNRAHHYA